jgi:ribosome-associated heat shock protein Hsp15
MTGPARQRLDLWLFRARFAKTRAAAARLIGEGGVRVVREGAGRRLEKPSAEISAGDAILFPRKGRILAVRVERLAERRGSAVEARQLYRELDAETLA